MQELSKIDPNHELRQVPPFLASKAIISLIDKDFLIALTPIHYKDGESSRMGYNASILPVLMKNILTFIKI